MRKVAIQANVAGSEDCAAGLPVLWSGVGVLHHGPSGGLAYLILSNTV